MTKPPPPSTQTSDDPAIAPGTIAGSPTDDRPKKPLFARHLGGDITSIDLLKALAVTTMIIDHIGYYFIDDGSWWRLVGRFSAPIWLYLIGYALTQRIPTRLIAGAVILVITDAATMEPLLPVNILATIILARLALPILTRPGYLQIENLLPLTVLLAGLALPSWFSVEYGVLGILLALFGYLCRHERENYPALVLVGGACVGVYVAWQPLVFDFSPVQTAILGVGTVIMMLGLYRFEKRSFAGTATAWYAPIFRLLGRYTLEIYITHLVLFGILAFWLADYGYFDIFLLERPNYGPE